MELLSFTDKRLKKLASNPSRPVPGLKPGHQARLVEMIETIKQVEHPLDLMTEPAWRAHELTPRFPGVWSLWLNGNYRLTFRFNRGARAVEQLNLEDYH